MLSSVIQWSSNLSVQVAEIDTQHQRLIRLINQLYDAMTIGQGKQVVGQILDELADYTATHFRTEEKLFAEYDYPEAEHHRQEHLAFVKKVTEFKVQFEAGQAGISVALMGFLGDWLQAHIRASDRRYAPFLNARGVH